jgi:hypothetical protein
MKTIDKKPSGLPQMAAGATTSAEHAEVLAQVRKRMEESQARFAALAAKRDTIVLDGGDVVAFLRQMHDAQEELRTYEAAVSEASRRYDEALTREARVRTEADLQVARDVAVPGYEQGLRDMHTHLTAFLAAADVASAHRTAIEGSNMMAKANDRPDLVIDAAAIREDVKAELYEVPHSEPPVRFDGETDRAFNLRMLNHAHRQDAATWRDDPLKVVGEAAIEAIGKTLIPGSPFENTDRRIEVLKFQDKTGTGATSKIQAIDGKRPPPKRLGIDRPGLSSGGDAA